jgi:hypothetical protein
MHVSCGPEHDKGQKDVPTELQRIFRFGSIECANRDVLLLRRSAGRCPGLLLVLSLLLRMVLRTTGIIVIVVIISVDSVSAMAIVMMASAAHGPFT